MHGFGTDFFDGFPRPINSDNPANCTFLEKLKQPHPHSQQKNISLHHETENKTYKDMLTIKQITEDTDKVIRGLEKKHFANAKETIAQVLELNDKRRNAQNQLDKNLAEVNSTSKTIGALMKEGKKEEAESAKARVAEIKEVSKVTSDRNGPGCRRYAELALYHP